jgi:hypothetical protein
MADPMYHSPISPTGLHPTPLVELQAARISSGDKIRILDLLPGKEDDRIECEIREVSLSDGIEYEALSYVWGDKRNGRWIRIAGRQFEVTDNLYDALRRLRISNSKRALWVDQLCIIQSDNEEKTHQVNLMRLIYKSCSQCLIWLGDIVQEVVGFSVGDAEGALDFTRWISGPLEDLETIIPLSVSTAEARKRTFTAFKAMIKDGNPWWSRIWTVQEAVLPPRTTVVWGTLSIDWEILAVAALNLCTGQYPLGFEGVRDVFVGILDDFTGPIRGLEIAKAGENVLDMLQRWRYRGATDDRDKVYALMGLFPSMPFPNVQSCDYNLPTATLYTKVTLDLILLEDGLRPLVGRRSEPHMTLGLPTWALDLVCYHDETKRAWKWWTHSQRYKMFSADGDIPFTWRSVNNDSVLSLNGVLVDKVSEVGKVLVEDNWGDIQDKQLIDLSFDWEAMMNQYISRQPHWTYVNGENVRDAFWRTLLGDLIMEEFPVRRVADTDHQKFNTFRKTGSRNYVFTSLHDMMVKQAFFITQSGYIGIGPPTTVRGDEVWVLFGGQVPFVLKPKVVSEDASELLGHALNKQYTFVGDAFVYGIMDGEIVRDYDGTQNTILLH